MLLNHCKIGFKGVIKSMHGKGKNFQRLLEFGLAEGQQLELVRVAPLGDPIEIKLNRRLIAMRRSEAALIEML